jgi:hypothetical protein
MSARIPWAERRPRDMRDQDRHHRSKTELRLRQNFEQIDHTESSDLQEPTRTSQYMHGIKQGLVESLPSLIVAAYIPFLLS